MNTMRFNLLFNWQKVASLLAMTLLLLSACNSGNGPPVSFSVTSISGSNGTVSNGSSSCTNMTAGSTCTINLSFNNNNLTGLAITYMPNPLPTPFIIQNTFSYGLENCNNLVDNSASTVQTCAITITYYDPTPGAPNSQSINLVLSLDGVAATPITLSGD